MGIFNFLHKSRITPLMQRELDAQRVRLEREKEHALRDLKAELQEEHEVEMAVMNARILSKDNEIRELKDEIRKDRKLVKSVLNHAWLNKEISLNLRTHYQSIQNFVTSFHASVNVAIDEAESQFRALKKIPKLRDILEDKQ